MRESEKEQKRERERERVVQSEREREKEQNRERERDREREESGPEFTCGQTQTLLELHTGCLDQIRLRSDDFDLIR